MNEEEKNLTAREMKLPVPIYECKFCNQIIKKRMEWIIIHLLEHLIDAHHKE